MQNIQGADILASIQTMTPGLARYYDDPPIPVTFAIEGIPPTMILDAEQVQRAILNLLDNALAHTAPGGTITVHSQLDNGDWLIAVEDSGPGIPASIIQALNSSPASAPPVSIGPHFGLGLCQVYATAAHHGGRATIDSTPHGSTVQIRLPVAPEA
ncbi:MAG: ATP-binding protein [Anaerolineae bacterium]|nr:MAG: ATP-binding protein [Anaerolineae bacterium]